MTNTLSHSHTDDRSELLSGYLDRALDIGEYREAEQTLKECAACVAELGELRSLHTLLRELPAPVPRRSFTLDPATVRPRRLLFPLFRFASLAAAMLLVTVLGVDAFANRAGQPTTTSQTGAASESAPAAGGVAPAGGEATEPMGDAASSLEVTTEPPMTALQAPAPTTAAAAAPASEAPESATAETSAADAAANSAAEVTTEPFGMMEATAGAALVPPSALDTATAGGDVGTAPETLRRSDSAASETETLTVPAPEVVAPPIDLWRIAAYVLALFVIAFGSAWWWTARRGI